MIRRSLRDVQNLPHGLYIVTLPSTTTLEMEVKDENHNYRMSLTFQAQEGVTIFCCCNIRDRNLSVTLSCTDRHEKFWRWRECDPMVCIADTGSPGGLRSEEALFKLSLAEWSTTYRFGPATIGGDNFIRLKFLDRCNQSHPICQHNWRKKPRPPPWYATLLGFRRREQRDWLGRPLNLDILFRDGWA